MIGRETNWNREEGSPGERSGIAGEAIVGGENRVTVSSFQSYFSLFGPPASVVRHRFLTKTSRTHPRIEMLAMKSKDLEPAPVRHSSPFHSDSNRRCSGTRLQQLSAALLSSVSGRVTPVHPPLSCPLCQWIPFVPVTLPCGHTACKPCLELVSSCPECRGPLPPRAETNILLKAAVEKWWAPESEAARIKEQGDHLLRANSLERALDKYNSALRIAPNNHLLLDARANVLLRLNRWDDSLNDAHALTRLRPLWPKGYYRRGVILAHLGQYDDALLSFSICVALDKNVDKIKQDFTKALQRFLSPSYPCKGVNVKQRIPLVSWWSNPQLPQHNFSTIPPLEDKLIENLNKPATVNFKSTESEKLNILLDRIFEEVEKAAKIKNGGQALVIRRNVIEPEDFECVLCCRTLWRPVTTHCGHTYCALCLDRCLDYSPNCPLCMTSLSRYLGSSEKSVTDFLEVALSTALPEEYTSRLLSHRQEATNLKSAPDIPVFVCTTAFPTVPCPLFVFEPRYRLMIRRVIDSGRKFGMAACVHQHNGVKRFAEFGTILEIKDIVILNDGCSILSNIGARRFRVTSRGECDGYDTAQVNYIIDDPIPLNYLPELTKLHDIVYRRSVMWFTSMEDDMKTKILQTFGSMPPLESNWPMLEDGPAWAWWLLAILPLGQRLQIDILGTTCLEKRLRAIDKTLKHFEGGNPSIESVSRLTESKLKRSAPATSESPTT